MRPLGLGDLLGGAVQTIRRNPAATTGTALLVTAVFMVVPVLASVTLGASGVGREFTLTGTEDPFGGAGGVAYYGISVLSALLSGLASVVISGLIVRVVGAAVVGRPMRAGEAWRRTRRRLPALVGLSRRVPATKPPHCRSGITNTVSTASEKRRPSAWARLETMPRVPKPSRLASG